MTHPATTGIVDLWLKSPKKVLRGFGQDPAATTGEQPSEGELMSRCIMAGGKWNDYTRACEFPEKKPDLQLSGWAYVASAVGTLAIIGGFAWYVSRKG